MIRILVSDFFPMAMTEEQGMAIRKEISSAFRKADAVVLDFSSIELFATMFFNASIGYFAKQRGVSFCEEHISIDHISDLGYETYQHSLNNARNVLLNDSNDIDSMIRRNIEDS